MIPSRRSFLGGLIAAPAVIAVERLMPVRLWEPVLNRTPAQQMFDEYLREIAQRRQLYDYVVICDETNNSQHDIDMGLMKIDLYVPDRRPWYTLDMVVRRA